jgi:hypothetical protein
MGAETDCFRSAFKKGAGGFLAGLVFLTVWWAAPQAWATCHQSCYDIDLVNDGECIEGQSVWEYQASVGTTESCFSLDKFTIKVFDCNDIDSVETSTGADVPHSCSDGILTINPSGTIPSKAIVDANEHFTFNYKVTMKSCLRCPTDGHWKTFSNTDDSCQFTGDTQVPEACECREDSDCVDDGDPCTDESCNENHTCDHTPNTGNSCDDGHACTNDDTCQAGTCVGTPQGEGCKECENPEECDDGLVCNGVETCGDDGICHNGTPLVCEDDGNPCTDDVCSENAGGCDHPNNEKPCDDGDVCTTADSCHDGVCVPGPVDPECTPPPSGCGNGTCDEGETCGTCPGDCGECPPGGSQCGNGVCDAGEDCGCSDCAERQDCVIEAQRLKCVQNLTSQGVNPETANNLAGQGICEALLEGESSIGGGCSLSPRGTSPLVNLVGTILFFGATAPLFFLRRAKRIRG